MTKARRTKNERPLRSVAALSWAELLVEAVTVPGRILAAYSAFHEYSIGNQLAAYSQCVSRGLPLGPLGTYRQWTERGRQVQRGAKAIVLCVPRAVKARGPPKSEDEEAVEPVARDDGLATASDAGSFVVFSWQPRWFVLSQTDGEEFVLPAIPRWDRDRALDSLGVGMTPFAHLDGNVQGYAEGRSIAVNPFAALPLKTLFHELAHALLHQEDRAVADEQVLPRSLREAEAEAVALLCVEALGLPGSEFARGYIQSWLGAGHDIPEASARRIIAAADRIIRAGTTGAAGRTAA